MTVRMVASCCRGCFGRGQEGAEARQEACTRKEVAKVMHRERKFRVKFRHIAQKSANRHEFFLDILLPLTRRLIYDGESRAFRVKFHKLCVNKMKESFLQLDLVKFA